MANERHTGIRTIVKNSNETQTVDIAIRRLRKVAPDGMQRAQMLLKVWRIWSLLHDQRSVVQGIMAQEQAKGIESTTENYVDLAIARQLVPVDGWTMAAAAPKAIIRCPGLCCKLFCHSMDKIICWRSQLQIYDVLCAKLYRAMKHGLEDMNTAVQDLRKRTSHWNIAEFLTSSRPFWNFKLISDQPTSTASSEIVSGL